MLKRGKNTSTAGIKNLDVENGKKIIQSLRNLQFVISKILEERTNKDPICRKTKKNTATTKIEREKQTSPETDHACMAPRWSTQPDPRLPLLDSQLQPPPDPPWQPPSASGAPALSAPLFPIAVPRTEPPPLDLGARPP